MDKKNAPVKPQETPKKTKAVSDTPKLATSAKDVINARYAKTGSTPSKPKTASSLHAHSTPHKHRLESVRPSASSLLQSSTQDSPHTIVRTSLKLAPKRNPVASKPRSLTSANQVANALRPNKQHSRLAMDMMSRRSAGSESSHPGQKKSAVAAIKAAAAAATPAVPVKKVAANPQAKATARPMRLVDDFKRPNRPISLESFDQPGGTPSLSLKSRQKSATDRLKARPLDSLKNRFRPAPKDFATSDPRKARPYRVEDFLNPTKTAPSESPAEDEAIHFYGMVEDTEVVESSEPIVSTSEADLSDVPAWVGQQNSATSDNLGVVEDYHPAPGAAPITPAEEPVPVDKKASPDNNRYALGARSPYFLESVQVEKRPLSDSSPLPRRLVETPIYAGQSLEEPTSKKNVYEKKSKSAKKSSKNLDATVIVPSRHRSHAPLFGLLILTIILGALVGAAAYLFFFQ